MSNKLKFVIDEKNAGQKFIHFLKVELKMSTRFTRKMAKEGLGNINGYRGTNSDILKLGDRVEITLDAGETQDIQAEDIPLMVAYEDKDLLIVNKPPFMVVHPTKSHQSGTLANAIVNYFQATNQMCIVRMVNRLDRDTSGLVIVGKSQYAHQQMANMLISNDIEKYYIALVEGKLLKDGTINLPIGRPTLDSIKREVMEEGQVAVTHYEIMTGVEKFTALKVKLETGRTHQIRVHLSHIGYPLIGDTLYGKESAYINRQALHSYKLKFKSIRNKEIVEVCAPLPDDMKDILDMMEKGTI